MDDDMTALKKKNVIYFEVIDDPRVKLSVLEQGILLMMRAVFDQYINLRPVTSWFLLVPLKREAPFDIHFLRENIEDFYMGANGFFGQPHRGFKQHVYVDRALYSLNIDARSSNSDNFAFKIRLLFWIAVTRFADYRCRYAQLRGERKVTLVNKTNVITRKCSMQRQIFQEKAREYGLDLEFMFVDIMAMIVRPETFGTIAILNLFGGVLTDLGMQLQGGLKMGRSGNINPERVSMFELIHKFTLDIVGRGIANLIAVMLVAQMLLKE